MGFTHEAVLPTPTQPYLLLRAFSFWRWAEGKCLGFLSVLLPIASELALGPRAGDKRISNPFSNSYQVGPGSIDRPVIPPLRRLGQEDGE